MVAQGWQRGSCDRQGSPVTLSCAFKKRLGTEVRPRPHSVTAPSAAEDTWCGGRGVEGGAWREGRGVVGRGGEGRGREGRGRARGPRGSCHGSPGSPPAHAGDFFQAPQTQLKLIAVSLQAPEVASLLPSQKGRETGDMGQLALSLCCLQAAIGDQATR